MNIKSIKKSLSSIISPFHEMAQTGRSNLGSFFSFSPSFLSHSSVYLVSPISIKDFKVLFDEELKLFFKEKHHFIESLLSNDQTNIVLSLYEQATAITLAGGKRIRPYMAFLSYVSTSQYSHLTEIQVIRSVICLELFHAFALIHDDIIDAADERHGLPTVHAFFNQISHTSFPNEIAEKHIDVRIGAPISEVGKSHAIMIGDLFFSLAQEAITKFVPSDMQISVREYFDTMATEVVIGEMLDVHQTILNKVSDNAIQQKNDLKTARYTFVNPIKIGFALSGEQVSLVHRSNDSVPKNDLIEFADVFGAELGFGFQVQDDMLDIIGTESKTGKPELLDIAEGQHTIFTQYILNFNEIYKSKKSVDCRTCEINTEKIDNTCNIEVKNKKNTNIESLTHLDNKLISDNDIRRFKSLLGKKEMQGSFLNHEEGVFVRELMNRTGAIKYGKSLIEQSLFRARKSLEKVHIAHKQNWEEIILLIENRNN